MSDSRWVRSACTINDEDVNYTTSTGCSQIYSILMDCT